MGKGNYGQNSLTSFKYWPLPFELLLFFPMQTHMWNCSLYSPSVPSPHSKTCYHFSNKVVLWPHKVLPTTCFLSEFETPWQKALFPQLLSHMESLSENVQRMTVLAQSFLSSHIAFFLLYLAFLPSLSENKLCWACSSSLLDWHYCNSLTLTFILPSQLSPNVVKTVTYSKTLKPPTPPSHHSAQPGGAIS